VNGPAVKKRGCARFCNEAGAIFPKQDDPEVPAARLDRPLGEHE